MTAAMRFVTGMACALLFSALFPVEVHAQKVALVHADIATRADAVRTKLIAAGIADADITVIDAGLATPALEDLQQYNAVLVWSNLGYLDSVSLGDTLAAYVDEGGGVVQAVFAFDPGTPSLGGRWQAEQYAALSSASALIEFDLTVVPVQPAHAILAGANLSPGGAVFYSPNLIQGGSDDVAHWSNGHPLVATRPGPNGGQIAGLNLYPFMGDTGQLMVNTLRFVAGDVAAPIDGPAVALLAAGGASAGAGDVRSKLRSLNLFSRVAVIDVASSTPALATLLQYDAVLTWSSANYGDPTALGDVLADYVDQNRGVVQSVFGYDATSGLHLDGRWRAEGYRPLTEGVAVPAPFSPLTLLPVVPAHPMLSGVSSFNGGTSSHHNAAALDGATNLVATWSDGQPFAAFGTKASGGRVVALNMYPPSSDAAGDLWDSATDGARLMANALLFAANHFPTASAGADQTGEATSPAGMTFTLNATGSDLDGDPLSFAWSGAVTASGESITVDVPPPPAPHQSHTVTLTLTVADGKGGETTDSVDLTVTDLVAPELRDMPADITVEASSETGATVSYGPVTAIDAIDGEVPVVCSQSGEFPIGDTLVTCSASDSRGNAASASFTVRVTAPASDDPESSVPGRMNGYGFIRDNGWHYEFGFSAMKSASGAERGSMELNVKPGSRTGFRYHRRAGGRFVSTAVDSVTFGADCTVMLTGTGRWNGTDGYRYELAAADKRPRRRSHDVVRITITSPDGDVVAHVEGRLDAGNIRFNSRRN